MTGKAHGVSNREPSQADKGHGTLAVHLQPSGDKLDGAPRIKIFGAGSIGNHVAHAARRLGWSVVVCDISAAALRRMRTEIYPKRYGSWDPLIELYEVERAPVGGFDIVHVGTPPAFHIRVALDAIAESPRALLIEKPLCPPGLDGVTQLVERAEQTRTSVFVGYDHVVGRAARRVGELLVDSAIGKIAGIDVEFREHWGGILAAHPWLKGPTDSYLASWEAGGGASGEHSHATNLWQHFAHTVNAGRVTEVGATLRYEEDRGSRWDAVCLMNLRTEAGLVGRVAQDVVSTPPRKRALIQGEQGTIEWIGGYSQHGDAVVRTYPDGREEREIFAKTRPDDFIDELKHVRSCLADGQLSPIRLERGIETMIVIRAAHQAAREGRVITVAYEPGRLLNGLPA